MSQVGEGALEAVQRIEGEAAEMADERRRTESVVDGLRTMVEAAAAAAMHAESLAADALSHAKSEREELVAGLTSDLDVMHSKLSNTQVRSSLCLSPSVVCSTPCLGERCSGQRTSRVPAGLCFTERLGSSVLWSATSAATRLHLHYYLLSLSLWRMLHTLPAGVARASGRRECPAKAFRFRVRLVRTLQCHQAAPLTSQPLCLLHTLVSLSVCVCVAGGGAPVFEGDGGRGGRPHARGHGGHARGAPRRAQGAAGA